MNAIVIGSSSGYGAAIAHALVTLGFNVVGMSRRKSKPPIFSIPCDVTSNSKVEAAFKAASEHLSGSVDVVVYSAGVAIDNRYVEAGKPEDWERVFQTNTLGLLRAARLSIPMMKAAVGAPCFVHIGSIAFAFTYEGGVDYCASKAAAHSIMNGLRYELLGTGIRTATIEAGLGKTEFQISRYAGDYARAEKHFKGVIQLEPEDVASAVVFAISTPAHVNIDEIIIKPTDQATHGKVAKK